MRASQDGRDDDGKRLELEEREHRARRSLLDAYLAVPSAGLMRAVVESEGFKAIAELRRVNAVLRENGFHGPLGAAGVGDMAASRGRVRFYEDELPLLLAIVEGADDGFSFQEPEYQRIIRKVRDAAAG